MNHIFNTYINTTTLSTFYKSGNQDKQFIITNNFGYKSTVKHHFSKYSETQYIL